MQIQQLTIVEEGDDQILVELQISYDRDLDESDQYLIACVRLPKPPATRTIGKLQSDALRELANVVGQASSEVEANLRADR